jgi:hypothetical protein
MYFIKGGIDIKGDHGHLLTASVDSTERLGDDTLKLTDMAKIESPEKISHRGRVGNISMPPDLFESLLLSEDNQVVKTDTSGDHAYRKPQDGLRFFESPLPLFDLDGGIYHPRQSEPMDELVDQKATAVTDKRVFSLFNNDFDSPGGIDLLDLLHLHLLGDRNADSLSYAQSLVYG